MNDDFILRFDIDGQLTWSTFIGGEGDEEPNILVSGEPAVAVDQNNNLFIVGTSYSPNASGANPFPTHSQSGFYEQLTNMDASQNQFGISDAYVMKFNPDNSLSWSSYFGGRGKNQNNVYGDQGIAIAPLPFVPDELYITGLTFSTQDFPLTCPNTNNPYCQGANTVNTDNSDAFLAKFDITPDATPVTNSRLKPFKFSVFPNPTNDELYVDFHFLQNFEVNLKVIDLLGQTISQQHFGAKMGRTLKNISMDNMPSGIYMVLVSAGEHTSTRKVIKQ